MGCHADPPTPTRRAFRHTPMPRKAHQPTPHPHKTPPTALSLRSVSRSPYLRPHTQAQKKTAPLPMLSYSLKYSIKLECYCCTCCYYSISKFLSPVTTQSPSVTPQPPLSHHSVTTQSPLSHHSGGKARWGAMQTSQHQPHALSGTQLRTAKRTNQPHTNTKPLPPRFPSWRPPSAADKKSFALGQCRPRNRMFSWTATHFYTSRPRFRPFSWMGPGLAGMYA